jgi:hypothetical protein
LPHVHVVEPVPLGGSLGYYSGEDMPEKTSMMAHSDVFLTVYSTMVVEAAIHDRPIVSVCMDAPGGWNWPRKFSLPLSQIGNWPTHDRFRVAGAGRWRWMSNRPARRSILPGEPAGGCEERARLSPRVHLIPTEAPAGARESFLSLLGEPEAEGYGSGAAMKILICGLGSIGSATCATCWHAGRAGYRALPHPPQHPAG